MLKRFLVFSGTGCCNPWHAFDGDFDTEDEALACGKKITHHVDAWDNPDYDGDYDENDDNSDYDPSVWCIIVDTKLRKIIKEMGHEPP
jgi:hypothetical protein